MNKRLFNLQLTNYSPYMAYTIISTDILDSKYVANIVRKFKDSKYYNSRHYDLNIGDKHVIKTTSLSDGVTLQYSGKNRRYIDIRVTEYYYSVWLLIRGKWYLHRLNVKCNWNDYINIIINV